MTGRPSARRRRVSNWKAGRERAPTASASVPRESSSSTSSKIVCSSSSASVRPSISASGVLTRRSAPPGAMTAMPIGAWSKSVARRSSSTPSRPVMSRTTEKMRPASASSELEDSTQRQLPSGRRIRQRNGTVFWPSRRSSSCWAATAPWSAGWMRSQYERDSSSSCESPTNTHAARLARRMPPWIAVTTIASGATSNRRCSSAPSRMWESSLMASATIMRVPRYAERPDATDERQQGRYAPIRKVRLHPPMHDLAPGSQNTPTGAAPVSVHFVNNVLAAAASYIEVEPDTARDVLAGLGAFLSHRLRPARFVPLSQELDHVAVYVRLEQARFPGRLEAELPASDRLPATQCVPGEVQAPLGDVLGRWLGERRGQVRLAVRTRLDGTTLEAQLDEPGDPA